MSIIMKLLLLKLGFVGLLFGTLCKAENRYDNYEVIRIIPKNQDDLKLLHSIESLNAFTFWRDVGAIGSPVDIMVPPDRRSQMNEIISDHHLESKVMIPNVQSLLESERRSLPHKSQNKALTWNEYHELDTLHGWLQELANTYSNVKVVNGGKSYEGRDILGIEITNNANYPGVLIESGIHAREWIGPAATSWIIDQILKSDSGSVWKQFNYLYFPSVNPDGYVYTWESDRLWRKTRKPNRVGILTCYGADPNRNWDNHWMEGGSSSNPCTETYAGAAAFSEPETKNLADYFRTVASRYPIYIAFHSYGQYLMYPWGYTGTDTPMEATWKRIGDLAAADLKAVHGKVFAVGSIYDTIYQASGSSLEWYYGEFNSTMAYVFECRDQGENGFVLPASQIVATGEEHLAAIKRFLTEYQNLKKK